jgi:ATP-dependent DNA ligase
LAMTGRVATLIVEAARRIRTKLFVIDGEAVLLGVGGISDFDGPYDDEELGRTRRWRG